MRKWFIFLGIFVFLDIILFSSYLVLQRGNVNTSVVLKNNIFIATPTPTEKDVKLMLLGDVMIGRSVNMRSLDMNDVFYPFRKVADKLTGEDVVFANLENPIVYGCPRIEHGFTFCADPQMVKSLTYAGIDIVNLANNHTRNFGSKGLEDTKKILTDNSIKWVGEGNLETIDKNGTKFGFLGFDLFDNDLSQDYLDLIKKSKTRVDILVVGVHWGQEYTSKATITQEKQAKEMIDAGADVISGHHPHWIQNDEMLDGKPVYYSLGNFVFDQMWSEETKKGLAVELIYKGTDLTISKKYPIYMKEWAQPEWENTD